MTKTGKKFLERLAGIIESNYSHYEAWDIPVDSTEYADIIRPIKEKTNKIIRLYEKGYMTETEATIELAKMAE